ncbi:hypothetical protein SK803_28455 [Lentzea sp. BCCO 10_0856]|uniref:Lipoprotein n=1 Tax=Lentzea miocenica TaxID=3095431 RepID=A0ABU4T7M5_9PSEU|nr:hypothetical protein [Lentzea sp. BCCO 10_0856]MDX8034169.1 hypothetical protein [Lentzea sp. BCCO 10_0856]
MSKLGVVVLLVLCLGACAESGPTKQDVIAKIRADAGTKDAPAQVVECVADWYMGRPAAQRQAFVDGEVADQEPDQGVLDCLKGAAP